VAAANALGVHRLNASVLRASVSITDAELLRVARLIHAELRVDGLGENRSIKLRHSSIARIATRIAFGYQPGSPLFASEEEVYRALGRAAVGITEFWRSPWSKPIVDLTVSARQSAPAAAIAVAEGMADGAPQNDHVRSRLAQTYREAADLGDPIAAAATVASFFRENPDMARAASVRPLIREWAVASGLCTDTDDHGARNAWLSLWSLSDQVDGQVTVDDARHLSTVTRGLSLMPASFSEDTRERSAAAVAAALKLIPGAQHLRDAEQVAGRSRDSVAVQDVGATLAVASQEIWLAMRRDFREHPAVSQAGDLSFRSLDRLLSETRLRQQ